MKISGVVVIYNPNFDEVIANIRTYSESLEKLYILDNSDNEISYREKLVGLSSNIQYHSLGGNKGISFALNYICNILYDSGFEWILTMDQDSSFPSIKESFSYINFINKAGIFDALISPVYPNENVGNEHFFTSGSLIKLEAWKKLGGFDENLFIDEVDGDFTYRLLEAGYKLLKVKNINLNHDLGKPISKKFLWKKLSSDNHSALRKYYIARNRVYLMIKRPGMRKIYFVDSFAKFIVFVLIESNRPIKLLMILKGITHGIIGKMGGYNKSWL